MLNLENMAGDSVLRTAGLKAPGERDAPTNVAGAMWKLAAGLFPEVRYRSSPLVVCKRVHELTSEVERTGRIIITR